MDRAHASVLRGQGTVGGARCACIGDRAQGTVDRGFAEAESILCFLLFNSEQ